MEALVPSTSSSRLAEPYACRHPNVSSFLKFRYLGQSLKANRKSECLGRFTSRCGVRAVNHEVFDGRESDFALGNGSAFSGLELKPSNSEVGFTEQEVSEEKSKEVPCFDANNPVVRTSKTGLFRMPISGGLHSATAVLDLVSPALAVRNLMEQARFAHLCTTMSQMNHRRAGYPCGSLVDFIVDSLGHPIFSLSPLAMHTRNLSADPRCTLLVQIPGWSGLSSARATLFGDVTALPADEQGWACQQFISKHHQWASQQWGNFYYYRMNIVRDIYFIGGFGTIQWLDIKDYENSHPDKIATDGGEHNLNELNSIFCKPLKDILSTDGEIDDVAFISIDSKGTDIRVRQGSQSSIQRLSFGVKNGVQTLEEAKKALHRVINRGCKSRGNCIS